MSKEITPQYGNNKDTDFKITPDELRESIRASENGTHDGLEKWEHLRITDSTPIPDPVPLITIAGEIIAIEGGLLTISGAPKSGKSALCSMIISGAIQSTYTGPVLDQVVVTANTSEKAVIYFDTEQADWKHQKNLKSILDRSGMDTCPSYFYSYPIRTLDLKEFREITDDVCRYASEKHGGIHLMVIDGIADYIPDTNKIDQSEEIVAYFLSLCSTYSTAIISIIHTNKTSETERGHLGSVLQRKSDSVIRIKDEGGISVIEPVWLRHANKADIPRISYCFDKELGYHVGNGILPPKQDGDGMTPGALEKLCREIFADGVSLKHQDVIRAIMDKMGMGYNKAVDIHRRFKESELIIQERERGPWRMNPAKCD